MALSLSDLGVREYADQRFATKGGYDRLYDLVFVRKWPRGEVAREFGITREWLRQIIKRIEEETNAGA